MIKNLIITKNGEEKIKKELKDLKKKKINLLKEFDRVRKMGDLSENSEYLTIKNLKINLENRIKRLENIISSHEIFNEKKIKDKNKILFSANIEIENIDEKKIEKYKIVSDEEINIKNNYISINSPLAKSLIGKKKDDIITIKKLNKIKKYKILSINYD